MKAVCGWKHNLVCESSSLQYILEGLAADAKKVVLFEDLYVPARDTSVAGVQRRVIQTAALCVRKRIACEPVVAPAWKSRRAIRAEPTVLPSNIRARQNTTLEAVLGCLLLCFCGEITRLEKLVDNALILADAVGKHTTMIAVGIETPLHVNDVTRIVSYDRGRTPAWTGLIVVHAYSRIVTTGTGTAYFCRGEIRPRRHRLEDGAFRASIRARLWGLASIQKRRGWSVEKNLLVR